MLKNMESNNGKENHIQEIKNAGKIKSESINHIEEIKNAGNNNKTTSSVKKIKSAGNNNSKPTSSVKETKGVDNNKRNATNIENFKDERMNKSSITNLENIKKAGANKKNNGIKWDLDETETTLGNIEQLRQVGSSLQDCFEAFNKSIMTISVSMRDPRGEFQMNWDGYNASFSSLNTKIKTFYSIIDDATNNVKRTHDDIVNTEKENIRIIEEALTAYNNLMGQSNILNKYIVGRYYWSNGSIKEKTWDENLQMYVKTDSDRIIKENVKMENAKKGEDIDLVILSGKIEEIKNTDYFFRGNAYYSYVIDDNGKISLKKMFDDKQIYKKTKVEKDTSSNLHLENKSIDDDDQINIVNKNATYGKNMERVLILNNDGLWEFLNGTDKSQPFIVNNKIKEQITKLKEKGIYDGKGDMKVRIDMRGNIYVYKHTQVPVTDKNGKIKLENGALYKEYLIDSHELVLEELHVDKNGKLVNKDGDIIYNKNNKDRSYKNLDSHFYMDINGNIISDNSDKGEGGLFPIIEYDKIAVERNQSNVVKDIGINDDSVQSVNNGEDESSGYTHRKIYSNNYEPEYVEKSESQQPVHQSAEPPKVEPPKVEQPKVEPPKVEPPTVEQPVDEPPVEEMPEEKTIEDPYKEFISEESQNEEPVYDEEYEEPIPSDEYEETTPSEEVYEEPVSYEEPYEEQIPDETEYVETISDEDAFEESFNNFGDNNSSDE